MKKQSRIAYAFLAPFLVLFVAFYLSPIVYAAYLSLFTKKRIGLRAAQDVFSGLANYIRGFQDINFLISLKNILIFGIFQIPTMLIAALVLALLLDQSRGVLMRVCRTFYFIPYTIPIAIGGLVWGCLYARDLSPVNQILSTLNLARIDFLSPSLILFSIANITFWTWTGYNMITLFAALRNIPDELSEAARVDGAKRWDIVWRIKLPLLMPTFQLLVLFSIIGTSQIFAEAWVLRPIEYVADNITPNVYIYLTAARDTNYSYAAALAISLAAVVFVISWFLLRKLQPH
jgi:multiple sugar transport system permease protein